MVFAAHCYALCAAYAVAVSVCPSVTFVDHVKMNKRILKIFSSSGSELRSDKNSYRRPCSVDRTVGEWRRTSECLFVTACSMEEYAEEKRIEKKFIVRSGISEAETTNNNRLRSAFCIKAIQTRSIARPLCDSRASCLCMGLMGMPYSRGKLEMRSDQGKFSKLEPGE